MIKMKKILIILLVITLLTACKKEVVIDTSTVKCVNELNITTVKEGNEYSCTLLNENYIFKITKIENDSIIIETDKEGLSSANVGLVSEKEWTLIKGKELVIHTTTLDYREEVIFKWEN